jgi:hypothetical protein
MSPSLRARRPRGASLDREQLQWKVAICFGGGGLTVLNTSIEIRRAIGASLPAQTRQRRSHPLRAVIGKLHLMEYYGR